VPVEIKFCGLTRPEDAAQAGALGASYAGVIFAGGPRRLDAARAAEVLAAAGSVIRRVGVFGDQSPEEIARIVRDVRLDVVQLHGDPPSAIIRRVRSESGAEVWGVIRVSGRELAARIAELDADADAVVLDSLVAGKLGGTGVTFDWRALTHDARPVRARLVAAGGLTPDNVTAAIRALAPHVVDVSSGVEREGEPGIKDHARMRAFADAVHHFQRD
jgi:phosphoribosylanthranilate isomerase